MTLPIDNCATSNVVYAGETNAIPSRAWSLFPVMCLTAVLVSIFALCNIRISATIDWSDQADLFHAINSGLSVLPEWFWSNLTQLGDAAVIIPLLALALFNKGKSWLPIIYSAPIAGFTCSVLKRVFDTPRPSALLEPGSFIQIGELLKGYNSFPSGHTTTVFVVIIAILCAYFPQPSNRKQQAIVSFGIFLALLIALSRIAVGAHWPLDILFGAGIGAASALIGTKLANKSKNLWVRHSVIQWIATLLPSIASLILLHRITFAGESDLIVLIAAISGVIASPCLMYKKAQIPEQSSHTSLA